MRNRLLAWMVLGLFVSVFSAVGILAYVQHGTTVRRFHEQHEMIVGFAVYNIQMGLVSQDFQAIKSFINQLEQYSIFEGVIIFDNDKNQLLSSPAGFALPETHSGDASPGRFNEGAVTYDIKELNYKNGDNIGRLVIALTLAPMNAETRRALLITAGVGIFILLPVMAAIAWRLRWYELTLKENESTLREKNEALEITQVTLQQTKNEVEHMLNNLDEGVFTINPDYTINEQHSLRARMLFDIDDLHEVDIGTLFGAGAAKVATFKKWVDLVKEPRMLKRWQSTIKLNPFLQIRKQKDGEEQIIQIDYKPIIDDMSLEKILVLAKDITEKVKYEEALARSKVEQKMLMERMVAFTSDDKATVEAFIREMDGYLKQFYAIRSPDDLSSKAPALYRDMHTIKGNSGTFGLNRLAKLASALEDILAKCDGQVTMERYLGWSRHLMEFTTEIVEITKLHKRLFASDRDEMIISRTTYNALLHTLETGETSDAAEIYAGLCNLNSQPFDSYCKKYQRIIKDYRKQYKKDILDLQIDNPKQLIHRDVMAALDASLVHLFRNAVDHGIEGDEEREAAGKGQGAISISFESDDNGATLTISDNGKGVEPEEITSLAISKNLISKKKAATLSEQEKIDLIFEPGFSSKQEVTEISGRGVGMDAVRTDLQALNGTVEIESQMGKGTTFMLKIPPLSGTGESLKKNQPINQRS